MTGLGLGLDAGGTSTRWALADARGRVVAQGQVAACSGAMMASASGRETLTALWVALAQTVRQFGTLGAICTGITGLDRDSVEPMRRLAGQAMGLGADRIEIASDIEMACLASFAPGEGYVVYAGTGSIAGFVDETGALQRAGGRGVLIDDAGGGHWIATQALRALWRLEDESPGSAASTPLGRCIGERIAERMGAADWAATRQYLTQATRGEIGLLALAVAQAAAQDEAAHDILCRAGQELARLALALAQRHGWRPVALVGRVFELSPAIEHSLRAAMPAAISVQRQALAAQVAAASRAALAASSRSRNASHPAPPPQIRTCGTTAYGSCLGS